MRVAVACAHCRGPACSPDAPSCACGCSTCRARRSALTEAQCIAGGPPAPVPGELAAAWERRRAEARRLETTLVLAGDVAAQIDGLFRAAKTGCNVEHCRKGSCDPTRVTCRCLCNPCGERRGLFMVAVSVVFPALEDRNLPVPRILSEEAAVRWRAACAAEGVAHCCTKELCEAGGVLCACPCRGCGRVLELLDR